MANRGIIILLVLVISTAAERSSEAQIQKKNSLANFYYSLPHAVADGVQWVGGLGKGIRGLSSLSRTG